MGAHESAKANPKVVPLMESMIGGLGVGRSRPPFLSDGEHDFMRVRAMIYIKYKLYLASKDKSRHSAAHLMKNINNGQVNQGKKYISCR
jgi:hypothetical protein